MSALTLGDLRLADVLQAVQGDGLYLEASPFVMHVRSEIPVVSEGIWRLYANHRCWLKTGEVFADFHVNLKSRWRPFKPLCVFELDGHQPFTPLAYGEAFAFFEWGFNWCVSSYCHQWLTIHSAVLEKNGRAVILPAPPGSGKSTLCAALMHGGWRLLSDEMALLDPATGLLTASARPISLKNASIEIMKQRAPEAVFGPVAKDTLKGTVCHMQPSLESSMRAPEKAKPAWVIFPKYQAGSALTLRPRAKAASLISLHTNSFNHHVHGRRGFEALANVVDVCDIYDLQYSQLDEALLRFNALAEAAA